MDNKTAGQQCCGASPSYIKIHPPYTLSNLSALCPQIPPWSTGCPSTHLVYWHCAHYIYWLYQHRDPSICYIYWQHCGCYWLCQHCVLNILSIIPTLCPIYLRSSDCTHIVPPNTHYIYWQHCASILFMSTSCNNTVPHNTHPQYVYWLYRFWKEGSKGKSFWHVSSRVLLFLLVETQVDPGGEGPHHRQPGKGEGDHLDAGQCDCNHNDQQGKVLHVCTGRRGEGNVSSSKLNF